MDGLDHRGHPRRSLWSAFYLAALVMGALHLERQVTEASEKS